MVTYRFIATIPAISLGKKVSLAGLSPFLKNITLSQGDPKKVIIEVTKSRTWPETVAYNEASAEVEELLDRMSLIDNHKISSCEYIGHIDDHGISHEPRGRGGSTATLTAGIPDPEAFYGLDRQRSILSGKVNPGFCRIHRIAQSMPDGIGKFLLLYGTIQVMYGETQAKVDDYILSCRSDTQLVQGKHRTETVVTHLRNMIAHPEDSIDVDALETQAKAYCPMLQEMVRIEMIKMIKTM